MIASTITIPVLGQPHLLEAALKGLVENSYYRHRIVVITSEAPPDEHHTGGARDWATVEGMDGQPATCRRLYESVDDFRTQRADWLAEHGIEFVDVTDQAREMHARYRRGEVDRRTLVEGGTDVAFKNNLGLAMTDTEWTIPNWDCDF
ncbi:MAG TPA: hypothetical protein VNV25_25715 [Gemmatimonadaceae bacterium]|nr:hypothetical protein [Gemmatimonadaceae bacterium]